MKDDKEKILLITDIPPCKNYTGGIMLSQMINFLLEEKHDVHCNCVLDSSISPLFDYSVMDNIKFVTYNRLEEDFSISKLSKRNYYNEINKIKKSVVKYIKENNIEKVWCVIQGEVIVEVIDYIQNQLSIKCITQIWDPIEWWMQEHKFNSKRENKVLQKYKKIIMNSRYCITTSTAMCNEYEKKYNVKCIEVMPPLKEMKIEIDESKKDDAKFIIALSGQIYAKEETEKLLLALDSMNWQCGDKEIFFDYYGQWSDTYIDTKKFNKERIIIHKFLPQQELLKKLSYVDLLYCPYFFSQNKVKKLVSKLSFPSKLITYMSLDVPILLHAPDYSSPYTFLENKNSAYLLNTLNIDKIKEKIRDIIFNKQSEREELIKNSKELFQQNFTMEKAKENFFKTLDIEYNKEKKMKILEVNNVDLPGRRFNGFDLQQMINNSTIHSAKQIVTYKTSVDENVLKFYEDNDKLNLEYSLLNNEAEYLSVHSNISLIDSVISNNDYFINSDLVHYHLIHNTKLSLYKMIELCKTKPSIWTIHDPWTFTGRCVYPQECPKWKSGCYDCEVLNNLFPLKEDNCNSLWRLKKEVYDRLDIDIVVTTPFMVDMIKESPITKNFKNVHVIPFGIDLDKFKDKISKAEARSKFNIDSEDIVLFFRAQIAMKGTEYIVEALKELKTDKKITLLSCSEEGLLEELRDKYNIIDLGHIEDEKMVMAYSACDIFLMPSRGESFGLMAIEAMASSKPIVIFNNSALPSVTFAPECGVLVENKNSQKLMEAIKMLIENPEERRKRGELGRKLAEEHYDIKIYHEKIMELYKKVYERQKYKLNNIMIEENNKINYSSMDVQIIIKRLKKILFNVFGTLEEIPEFIKNEDADVVDNGEKIDYSILDVQEIIKQFNEFVYKLSSIKKKQEVIDMDEPKKPKESKIKKLMYFIKYDREKLKEAVKWRSKKYVFIYYPIKLTYKLVRKVKHEIQFFLTNKRELLNQINEMTLNKEITTYKLEELNERVNILEQIKEQMLSERTNVLDQNREQNDEVHNKLTSLDLIDKRIKSLEYISNSEIKNLFYYYGGSGNHGCEALIKTLMGIGKFKKDETCLCSYVASEDIKAGINNIIKHIKQSNQDAKEIENIIFNKDAMAFSIGGDNYCGYDYGTKRLEKYNRILNDKGVKTALIGCSIEPDVLEHNEVLDDLNRFSLITARESITYNALLNKGINRNTHLIPDSAFALERKELPLPKEFEEYNTIGINVSDMIQSYDKTSNMTYDNFKSLIQYIIDNTNYKIAFIPHVIQKHNDDMKTLVRLYNECSATNRIILIGEHNCREMKGYISRCKILVCARTHASIAGYSTNVPTLVLGYSVKSKGIAKDIFGTEENYVLPVESLKKSDDLLQAFKWIEENYGMIKQHLEEFMPSYIQKCYELEKVLNDFRNNKTAKMALVSKDFCIGCGVCNYVCPKNCIKMEQDDEGFIYPVTNYTKCVNCDICKMKCPVNTNKISIPHKNAYAVQNKNRDILSKSSSGGVFTVLAEEILKDDGIVFGVGFNEENTVTHMYIDKKEDLYKLRGSKYVQSDLKESFPKVKQFLENNRKVMFTGTPCQAFSLKQYLEKDYENLYCIDIACHGVPSPKLFKQHCDKLEKENNSKIIDINFRSKDKGWYEYRNKYIFEDGTSYNKVHHEEPYMREFLLNKSLRKSCYNCSFKNFKSKSDITLADYWRVEELHPEFNDNKGTSLVLVNSNKGNNLLENIKEKLRIIPTNIDYAISKNHYILEPVKYNEEREAFYQNIRNNKGDI